MPNPNPKTGGTKTPIAEPKPNFPSGAVKNVEGSADTGKPVKK